MTRVSLIEPSQATGKASELLDQVRKGLGLVPNMTRAMANSPAVLQSYLSFSGALGGGSLKAGLREQIAIAIAEQNACTYCLSAHTAIGGKLKVAGEELEAAREGRSSDPKTTAALRFALAVNESRGGVSQDEFDRVRGAGFSDAEITEIIATVALNVLTNYINRALAVEVDFPVVRPRQGVGVG